MLVIGLIREGKIPADARVALTPPQCKWLTHHFSGIRIVVQSSTIRCFKDAEYKRAGVSVEDDLSECNILLGIKEIPVSLLMDGKTYMIFSHTHKQQQHNASMLKAMMEKKITLIDYECLVHDDGQRIIGFGFFAGIVGAHNGIMAFGKRSGLFSLGRVYASKDYLQLVHTYFGLKLPNIKIAVTGSGRVAHGILEIMGLLDVKEVEPSQYLQQEFQYPVYVNLKSSELYQRKDNQSYKRDDFHTDPQSYNCVFEQYCAHTDILMNGVYWDTSVPKLFNIEVLKRKDFRIQTIADITDDTHGSIPCNIGDGTIENPVYGVNKKTFEKTNPYVEDSVDVMAVGNLPNELPRDASRYFGEQLIKYVLEDMRQGGSAIIDRATILKNGQLTERFAYLTDYALNP